MGAFDVVVLGGGTAGLHVATEVVGGGKTVALVEAGLIGGESPYLACLPSNSLLLSAARGRTWEDAVALRDEVTGGLDDLAPARRLTRAGVTVIRGTGRITGPGTVEVTLAPGADPAPAGTIVSLTYSDLVIATGCEPVRRDRGPVRHTGLDHRAEPVLARPAPAARRARRRVRGMRAHADLRLVRLTGDAGGSGILAAPGRTAFAGEILAAALRRAWARDLPRLPRHQSRAHV